MLWFLSLTLMVKVNGYGENVRVAKIKTIDDPSFCPHVYLDNNWRQKPKGILRVLVQQKKYGGQNITCNRSSLVHE